MLREQQPASGALPVSQCRSGIPGELPHKVAGSIVGLCPFEPPTTFVGKQMSNYGFSRYDLAKTKITEKLRVLSYMCF